MLHSLKIPKGRMFKVQNKSCVVFYQVPKGRNITAMGISPERAKLNAKRSDTAHSGLSIFNIQYGGLVPTARIYNPVGVVRFCSK